MLNIAIDGPAGAGKSTISKKIAEKLNITYLDTGAMYRAVALYMLQNNIPIQNEELVSKNLKNISIDFRGSSLDKHIFLNNVDVSKEIRQHEVSKAASDVSKIVIVRDTLVNMQRNIAKCTNVVLDGRDITSNVLKDAKYKFYLTASSQVRAKRRYDELIAKGTQIEFDTVLKDVEDRDYNDMNRAYAPLVKTEDSIEIDSTNMTIDEVVDKICSYISLNDIEKEPEVVNNIEISKPIKNPPITHKKHSIFIRAIVKIARGLMKILWPTKILYKEKFPKDGRSVVICNHYSKVDADPILSRLFDGKTNVVFKSELTKSAFIRNFLDCFGGIPIRRGESDMAALKKLIQKLENDEKILIFPEGTRNMSAAKVMLPFKEGAAMLALKTKSPIVPLFYYDYPGPFKKNYLLVGDAFTLEEFYKMKPKEGRDKATKYIRQKMEEMRIEIDCIVEQCGGNIKKYEEMKGKM